MTRLDPQYRLTLGRVAELKRDVGPRGMVAEIAKLRRRRAAVPEFWRTIVSS